MCGIAGIITWKKNPDRDEISSILDCLGHRGPDAEGTYSLQHLIFGHKRLSIIDVSEAAHQPMRDQDERFVITFNGEIYNYRELRQDLEGMGHVFRTSSDTEVILEGWKAWGQSVVSKLVGMFAFAIWDINAQSLYIVRDRMGEKPLYYMPYQAAWENGIVFASEMQALSATPGYAKRLNDKAVQQYMRLGYTLTGACIYEGIYKLPPAHILTLKKGSAPHLQQYWHLKDFLLNKDRSLTQSKACDALQGHLDHAVKLQLRSDVPVGLMLSGGVDSASIAASIHHSLGDDKKLKSFCAGFSDPSYDESQQSQKIAEHFNLSHHNVELETDVSFRELLESAVSKMDEPLADNSFLPMLSLSKKISQHVKVCLVGDAGDELFLGYETYVATLMHRYLRWLPGRTMSWIFSKVSNVSFNKVSFDFKLKRFLNGLALKTEEAHMEWRHMMSKGDVSELCSEMPDYDYFEQDIKPLFKEVEGAHYLDQMSYVDMKTWMIDDILVKADRATMAYGLEARAPFLDYRLVEFAASLPVHHKLGHMIQKKKVLKNALEKRLPKSLIQKKKRGFNTPVSLLLLNLEEGVFEDILREYDFPSYIDSDVLRRWYCEHCAFRSDRSYAIYTALVFMIWAKREGI